MRILYTLFIRLYTLLLRLASVRSEKARQWLKGRRNWQQKLEEAVETSGRGEMLVWFHVSSLGEFEQGRPVIEAFRKRWPGRNILLTFFSPSGYEIRKNYDQADIVCYLPADTPGNVNRFLDIVRPGMIFFVKYDFWFNYIHAIHQREIPLYYLSALFRPGQHFFRWYGGWFRKHLRMASHYFVQNAESQELLQKTGITGVTLTGDTRFDRVFEIALHPKPLPLVERFCQGKPLLVMGSSWEPDEAVCAPLIRRAGPDLKVILAPHDTSPGRIRSIREQLDRPCTLLSGLTEENAGSADILVIDSVGLLSQLYRFATVAFIGGGFGAGIHNIQEPVTFGVPVLFGPRFGKFREACDLVALGGAFAVNTPQEAEEKVMRLFDDSEAHRRASEVCRRYVEENRGATEKVIRFLEPVSTSRQP
ncbi:MAG TPA: glycosyltransferase N-terminal domain-containing protein [Bacteroidales bacterium]|nr:glycosyltransferase N-terminal domain-containing protein [Bacteroidales bacterium]